MCDYSAMSVKRRSTTAQVNERLVSSVLATFSNHRVIGFRDPAKPDEAVCMVPGTTLLVSVPEKLQNELGFKKVEKATFLRVGEDKPHQAHDALFFDSRGKILMLHELGDAAEVTVESVPEGDAAAEAEAAIDHAMAEEREVFAYV